MYQITCWLTEWYVTLTQGLCCVCTMPSVTTDAEKYTCWTTSSFHIPWEEYSLSTHNRAQPVKLQFSTTWVASVQWTSFISAETSRSVFYLPQVSVCVTQNKTLSNLVLVLYMTAMSSASVYNVNHRVKVITLKRCKWAAFFGQVAWY